MNTTNQNEPNNEEEIIFEDEGEFSADTVKKLRQKLKETESLKQEYLLGWQRAKADQINQNKQLENDRINFTKYATQNVVSDLIPVLDSFEMAFRDSSFKEAQGVWKKGVENIFEQLKSVMIQNGMSEVKPQEGDKFDPKEHEAVMTEEVSNEEDDNKILEVIQNGYKLNDRIIRAPKVKVSEYKN